MHPITTAVTREHRNLRCTACGHIGFSTAYPDEPVLHPGLCCHCQRAGRAMQAKPDTPGNEPWPPEEDGRAESAQPRPQHAPKPVTFAGHTLDAPGFSSDQFERAILRALVDELQVKTVTGQHIVHHPGLTHGYRVTRDRCDCKAGQVGTPCKHRALVILHLDIRMPAQRRQWARLHAERPALQPVGVA